MSLEATMIVLDNSAHSLNGDFPRKLPAKPSLVRARTVADALKSLSRPRDGPNNSIEASSAVRLGV